MTMDWGNTRVAVLGGGGFLGSHLVDHLRRNQRLIPLYIHNNGLIG